MTIGTAKPSASELQEVKHYFINNKSISELFGAGHFEKEALALLDDLYKEHSLVIVVGGSGLYINALLNGVDDFEEVPEEYRQQLNEEYKVKGLSALQEELLKKDPTYYNIVDIQNPQRVIRALEVIRFTGKPFSSFLKKNNVERNFTAIKIFLNTEREILYSNINRRVDDMMREGLLDEVKQLIPYKQVNALKTVGYKELFEYLEGRLTLNAAVDKIKQHTRNYAKRQITWFKHQDDFEEFGPEDTEKLLAYIDLILSHA